MEKELKKIFEYQRFSQNKRLNKMLIKSERDVNKELSDQDLSLVAGGKSEQDDIINDNDLILKILGWT